MFPLGDCPQTLGRLVILRILFESDDGWHADLVEALLFDLGAVRSHVTPSPLAESQLSIGALDRVASVEADVDNALEEDKVGLWELEGFELGPQQVAVLGVKVLKQERVNRAPSEMEKHLMSSPMRRLGKDSKIFTKH